MHGRFLTIQVNRGVKIDPVWVYGAWECLAGEDSRVVGLLIMTV